jgi:spore germination protein GerM
VLVPVDRAAGEPTTPDNVLRQLQTGPTDAEKQEGFAPTIPSSVRVVSVHVADGTATVNFGGVPPANFYTHAAVVFSLTALPGIDAVALRYNGRPCCIYDHDGNVITPATRRLYRGWPGEPCALRTYADAVTCRG